MYSAIARPRRVGLASLAEAHQQDGPFCNTQEHREHAEHGEYVEHREHHGFLKSGVIVGYVSRQCWHF